MTLKVKWEMLILFKKYHSGKVLSRTCFPYTVWDGFMSFESKFAITKISDLVSLSIDSLDDDKRVDAILFFTPDPGDTDEHYHIALKKNEVEELHLWCSSFLKCSDLEKKLSSDMKKVE